MVPKDDLIKIHSKLIINPFELIIKRDLSNTKQVLQDYIEKTQSWFETIETTNLDKKKFENFLDTFKDNIEEIMESQIDEGTKNQVKSYSNEFIKELEIHCGYFLKSKLKYIHDFINDGNEIANVKKFGRILLPILISIIILVLVYALFSFSMKNGILSNSQNSTLDLIDNSQDQNNSNLNLQNENSNEETQSTININYDDIDDTYNLSNDNIDNNPTNEFDENHGFANINSTTTEPISQPKSQYELSQTEKELLNLINTHRVKYYKSELKLNSELSQLLKNHTMEMAKTYVISNKDEYSDMKSRAEKLNIKVPIRENNFYYKYESGILSEFLFEKAKNNDLFIDELTHIALAVTLGEYSTYFVTIDLYNENEGQKK